MPPKKQKTLRFYVDCEQLESVIDLDNFREYLESRIKVDGKRHQLGELVRLQVSGQKILLTADIPFSKRQLKYLSRKYLHKNGLRGSVYVVSTDKNSYAMRLANIDGDVVDEEES